MGKTVDAGQELLLDRPGAELVNLVTLTTWSDHDARTTDTVYRFSEVAAIYGGVPYRPLLAAIQPIDEEIPHLSSPDDAGLERALRKRLTLILHNGDWSSTSRLIAELNLRTLEGAEIEWSQVAIEPGGRPWEVREKVRALGAVETVRYRGEIRGIQEIGDERIVFDCETVEPSLAWTIASDATQNDPRDLGRRLPILYGQAKKIRAVGWDVGAVTTLATAVTAGATSLILTDSTGFPTSGNLRMGNEEVSWSGLTGATHTLTGVTRGTQSTVAQAHAAGEGIVELKASAHVWRFSDHACSAFQALYVRNPFTGELVRVPSGFTSAVSPQASVSFTTSQLRTLLDNLAAAIEGATGESSFVQYPLAQQGGSDAIRDNQDHIVDQHPETNATISASGHNFVFPTPPGTISRQVIEALGVTPIQIKEDNDSGSDIMNIPGSAPDDEWYSVETTWANSQVHWEAGNGKRALRRVVHSDTPIKRIRQKATSTNFANDNLRDGNVNSVSPGATGWVEFEDVPASEGTFLWQEVRIYLTGANSKELTNTTSGGAKMGHYNDDSTDLDLATTGPNQFAIFTSEEDTNRIFLGSGNDPVAEVERDYVVQPAAGSVLTKGVSPEAGAGFEFYADVDGYEAPDGTNYIVGNGVLLEEAPDILRHLIAVRCGQGHTAIDSGWNAAGDASHLNDNVHAGDLRTLGTGFRDVVQRIAFESRANVTTEERSSGTVFRLAVAESDYEWPAAVRTLTEWAVFLEEGRDLETIVTRFRGLYAWDASRGDTDDGEAFRSAVRIDPDQNDVANPSTLELSDAEDAFGRRDGTVVHFLFTQDLDTAEEVLGYYAHERIRPVRLFRVEGVPWSQAFDLERLDVVEAVPPWESVARKFRVLDYRKDPATESVELVGVEVP